MAASTLAQLENLNISEDGEDQGNEEAGASNKIDESGKSPDKTSLEVPKYSEQSSKKEDVSAGVNKESTEPSSLEGKDTVSKEDELGSGHQMLYSWLNKNMKIEMTDGRILIGVFLCTDRDGNVILGSCSEYVNPEVCGFRDEPRILGLVMVPGRHIVSIHHDAGTPQTLDHEPSKWGCDVKTEGESRIRNVMFS